MFHTSSAPFQSGCGSFNYTSKIILVILLLIITRPLEILVNVGLNVLYDHFYIFNILIFYA